ncbi:hypothetical protein [Pseudoxanthomonas sp. Root630]|uniref:hypothetical protein n=1 Tax=Pseudoxanthomonas sp. Root630 TaxID=1736574 RepID=UPI000A7AA4F7|nr:hypothetical protein [Pseudoxanthomonas sp. Root630]
MAKSARYPVLISLQLCVPALLYVFIGLYNGRGTGLEYLLPNYLFMAAPHLLVGLVALWPRSRHSALLWVLSSLNVLLIAFQIWVLLAVPAHESGLAWVLYVPLWGATLLASAIIWLSAKHRVARRSLGA